MIVLERRKMQREKLSLQVGNVPRHISHPNSTTWAEFLNSMQFQEKIEIISCKMLRNVVSLTKVLHRELFSNNIVSVVINTKRLDTGLSEKETVYLLKSITTMHHIHVVDCSCFVVKRAIPRVLNVLFEANFPNLKGIWVSMESRLFPSYTKVDYYMISLLMRKFFLVRRFGYLNQFDRPFSDIAARQLFKHQNVVTVSRAVLLDYWKRN